MHRPTISCTSSGRHSQNMIHRPSPTRFKWLVILVTVMAIAVAVAVMVIVFTHRTDLPTFTATEKSPAISPVGVMASSFGSGVTTLSVNPQHSGDVLVVMAESDYSAVRVVSMAGGSVRVWVPALQRVGTGEPHAYSIWYGTVAAPGPSTIAFEWSGPITGDNAEYEAQEFSGGAGWYLDGAGSLDNPASTIVSFPSLIPSNEGDLYFAYADYGTSPASGGPGGYTYIITPDHNQIAYGVRVEEPPRSLLPSAAPSTTVAVLLASVS